MDDPPEPILVVRHLIVQAEKPNAETAAIGHHPRLVCDKAFSKLRDRRGDDRAGLFVVHHLLNLDVHPVNDVLDLNCH